MPLGEVASIEPKAAVATPVMQASAPPATTASAAPARIIRAASPSPLVPAAQAEATA